MSRLLILVIILKKQSRKLVKRDFLELFSVENSFGHPVIERNSQRMCYTVSHRNGKWLSAAKHNKKQSVGIDFCESFLMLRVDYSRV